MRLSIDITSEQHQCLKAAAALRGKTIKAYVLENVLSDAPGKDNADFLALEKLLKSRVEAADKGAVSSRSVADIVNETLHPANHQ